MARNHRSSAWAACVVPVLLLAGAAAAVADVVVTTDNGLPPEVGYIINTNTVTFAAPGSPTLQRLFLDNPSQRIGPPEGGGTVESFFDIFTEITIPPLPGSPFDDPDAPIGIRFHHLSTAGAVSTYETEVLYLAIAGGGTMLRESPTLPSMGETTITDEGDGTYQIDSFFDVFTELSLDGGNTWFPASGATHLTTHVPEPATMMLMGTGALGVLGWMRRRRMN